MPLLLSDAYGTTFARQMRSVELVKTKTKVKKTAAKPTLGTAQTPAQQKPRGNYEIHITIDRQDCHLLCLFIGVFTLAVLFSSNKREGPISSHVHNGFR